MNPNEPQQRVHEMIVAHLGSEVDCRVLESDGRVGCVTPLEFPNGDQVVVWVRPRNGTVEVTDYGETLAEAAPLKGQERARIEDFAKTASRSQGIEYDGGRLTAHCGWDQVGEVVWRLGTAMTQVAQAVQADRPQREPGEADQFAQEVARTLRENRLPVERERPIEGRSGHKHRATIFVPSSELVIEPVAGHMNQVNATYTKFGDLLNTNGYKLYSLLDDRKAPPREDVAGLLVQVSHVVNWSRHGEWLESLT